MINVTDYKVFLEVFLFHCRRENSLFHGVVLGILGMAGFLTIEVNGLF